MQMVIGVLDSSLEEVTRINMAKLKVRYPSGYSHDRAITHNGDKEAERATIDADVEFYAREREKEERR